MGDFQPTPFHSTLQYTNFKHKECFTEQFIVPIVYFGPPRYDIFVFRLYCRIRLVQQLGTGYIRCPYA
jgi:hypothetical protein